MSKPLIIRTGAGELRMTAKPDGTFELMSIESLRSLPGLTTVTVTKRQVDRMAGFAARNAKKEPAA